MTPISVASDDEEEDRRRHEGAYVVPDVDDNTIIVCSLRADGTQHRQEMKMSEYYKNLDNSKQFQFCSNRTCKHDIDMHAAVKNYKKDLAGRCNVHGCKCRRYKLGELITAKELETGKKRVKSTIGFPWQPMPLLED